MTTHKATIKNGKGRPINPYPKPIARHEITDWDKFEQTIITYDAPGIPDTKEGEFVEVELVWQEWESGWVDCPMQKHIVVGHNRIIYRLPQQPKEQEKETMETRLATDGKLFKIDDYIVLAAKTGSKGEGVGGGVEQYLT